MEQKLITLLITFMTFPYFIYLTAMLDKAIREGFLNMNDKLCDKIYHAGGPYIKRRKGV